MGFQLAVPLPTSQSCSLTSKLDLIMEEFQTRSAFVDWGSVFLYHPWEALRGFMLGQMQAWAKMLKTETAGAAQPGALQLATRMPLVWALILRSNWETRSRAYAVSLNRFHFLNFPLSKFQVLRIVESAYVGMNERG